MSAAGPRVVVLSYGAGGEHGPLLESLAHDGVASERVLLVHNPSAPGERPAGVPAGCETLIAERNLGYAAAMNLGIRRQLDRGCELLLLLTHDARLRPGALGALVSAARSNPGYGVLGPVLLLTGTNAPFSFGGTTGAGGGVAHRKAEPPGPGGVAACDWVDGGTMLIRAEGLGRVGGFDERFWGYFEDADLCLRMSRAGFGVGVAVGALADQAPGGPKRLGVWAYLMSRNGIEYARRAAGRRGLLAALARSVALAGFDALRAALRVLRLRRGLPIEPWAQAVGYARGVADFLRGRWGPPPAGLPGSSDLRNV